MSDKIKNADRHEFIKMNIQLKYTGGCQNLQKNDTHSKYSKNTELAN